MPTGICPEETTYWCPLRTDECEKLEKVGKLCIIVDMHSRTVGLEKAVKVVASLMKTEDPEKRKELLSQLEEIPWFRFKF